MKKVDPDDLRPEYRCGNLGAGVRGKYLESHRSGTNCEGIRQSGQEVPSERSAR